MNDENTLNINLVDVVNMQFNKKEISFITMFLICEKKTTKYVLSKSKVNSIYSFVADLSNCIIFAYLLSKQQLKQKC